MSASSLQFLAFSIVAAILHGAWSNPAWRKGVMLLANLAFVLSFTHSPRMLLPLSCFLVLGYFSLVAIRFKLGRLTNGIFAAGVVLLFCWLKRYWFLSFVGFSHSPYLVIGLSYMFFRVMGMVIDARTEPDVARVNPVDYFNFAANFPTFVAGPIDRYQDFSRASQPVTLQELGTAIQRIALGFLKVLALSTQALMWQTRATSALLASGSMSERSLHAAMSFGLYPVYLYFNFSGYTDIVIGIGYLFGKQYPENFNAPFSSFNFIDFWSRWHMSLSFWLRDYVYTPLLKRQMQMGFRQSFDPYLGVFAYIVTFFLIGIWHGSTAIFAVYGLLLALGVSANKLYQIGMARRMGKKRYRKLTENRWYRFVCRGLTYTWYSLCMVCFWNDGEHVRQLHTVLGTGSWVVLTLLLFVSVTLLLNLWEEGLAGLRRHVSFNMFGEFAPYLRAATIGVFVFCCIASVILGKSINAAIVYQAF